MRGILVIFLVSVMVTGIGCIVLGQTKFEELYDRYNLKHKKMADFLAEPNGEFLQEYKDLYSSLSYAPELAKYFAQDERLCTAFLEVTGMRKEIQYRKRGYPFDSRSHFLGLWNLGQKGLADRLESYLKALSNNNSEEAIILENINCLGFAVLPRCFLRIKTGERRLILPIIQLLSKSSFCYAPSAPEDAKISFDEALVICKENSLKRGYRVVPPAECWRWWKDNWRNWILPFPDQDYDAIEAEIAAADPTYVPRSNNPAILDTTFER